MRLNVSELSDTAEQQALDAYLEERAERRHAERLGVGDDPWREPPDDIEAIDHDPYVVPERKHIPKLTDGTCERCGHGAGCSAHVRPQDCKFGVSWRQGTGASGYLLVASWEDAREIAADLRRAGAIARTHVLDPEEL